MDGKDQGKIMISCFLDFVLINIIYIVLFLPEINGFYMEILLNFISIRALWVVLREMTGLKSGTGSPCLNLNLKLLSTSQMP